MVHAACSPARVPGFIVVSRLDLNRIFGYATAIAVHAVLLLLLLVPITAPPAVAPPQVEQIYRPIDRTATSSAASGPRRRAAAHGAPDPDAHHAAATSDQPADRGRRHGRDESDRDAAHDRCGRP